MTKRPGRRSLADYIDGPESAPPAPPAAPNAPEPAAPAEPEPVDVLGRAPAKLAQATGLTQFVFHLSVADKRRLKVLCAETGLSFQTIGIEGVNMFLKARGLPGLERVNASVPPGRKKI